MNYLRISAMWVAALFIAGCGPVIDVGDANENRAYLLAKLPPKPHSLSSNLHILVREGAFLPAVLDLFEKTYGITLTVDTYPDTQALLPSISAELTEYDLVMLTGYQLDIYLQQAQFATLDATDIPNLKQVDSPFHGLDYHSNQTHAVPIAQEVLGIAFNIHELAHFPRKWSQLKHNEDPSRIKGKIAIPATPRLLFGAAMIALKRDPNTIDPAAISAAIEAIKSLAEFEPIFDDDVHESLMSGKILLALDYSSDISRISDRNSNIRMILPEGGAIARVFMLAVPDSSTKKKTAKFLINYLLIPEIAASNSNYSHLASTVQNVGPYLESRVRNGPSYLQPSYGDQLYTITPLGAKEQLYDNALAELRELQDKQNTVLFNSASGTINSN